MKKVTTKLEYQQALKEGYVHLTSADKKGNLLAFNDEQEWQAHIDEQHLVGWHDGTGNAYDDSFGFNELPE